MKKLVILIFLLSTPLYAGSVMDNLKTFNPSDIFKHYTANPKEAALKPGENVDSLKSAGLQAIGQNKEASSLYQHVQTRKKVSNNPDSDEMKQAEKLLEQAEKMTEGGCYKIKGQCEMKIEKKTCQESLEFTKRTCKTRREVALKTTSQTIVRYFSRQTPREISIPLTTCPQGDIACISNNSKVTLTKDCSELSVKAYYRGQELEVLSAPACSRPEVRVRLPMIYFEPSITLVVSEHAARDSFKKEACLINQEGESCVMDSFNTCLEPNATKIINGVAVTRPCWGTVEHYQCGKISSSTCGDYLKQGCTQSGSECLVKNDNICKTYSQQFSCSSRTCGKEQEICFEKPKCLDGNCDEHQEEQSNDLGEGVSRLGALFGTAQDVSANQVSSGNASIFKGEAQECAKYPLGIKDCCTDKGWGDWVVNCPAEMKELMRAKREGRVVSLGSYKNSKIGKRHYAFCVFPSKLAGIVQIQGRGAQLRISFGSAKSPKCSGLTPEQLERIDFSKLDLSSITDELTSRKVFPDSGLSHQNNQRHIEQLNQRGQAHD